MSKFSVQGFLKNRRYKKVESTTINTNDYFDGLMLDEMQLNVTINTEKDVDDLELYLKWIRPCFRVVGESGKMEEWIKDNITDLAHNIYGNSPPIGMYNGHQVAVIKVDKRTLHIRPLNMSVDIGKGAGYGLTINF
jgi:hypothetical protein